MLKANRAGEESCNLKSCFYRVFCSTLTLAPRI